MGKYVKTGKGGGVDMTTYIQGTSAKSYCDISKYEYNMANLTKKAEAVKKRYVASTNTTTTTSLWSETYAYKLPFFLRDIFNRLSALNIEFSEHENSFALSLR